MLPFILAVLYHVVVVLHQASAQSGTPRCVPVGLCFPQSIDVNPRIVTPGEGSPPANNTEACTAGYELCYPLQGNFSCGTRYTNNISNANGPTSRGSHPWQVYMNYTSYIGSGVLLNRNIVLTAAHKVYTHVNTPSNITIYTGVNNQNGLTSPPAALSQASQIKIHENFKIDSATNKPVDYKDDIALIRLDTPQLIGYRTDLGLGCLPSPTDTFVGNPLCIVGGWGETQFQAGDGGRTHKQVTLEVVTMATCKTSMLRPTVLGVAGTAKYLDEQKELCAGGGSQRDACTQDGGAPLMCRNAAGRFVIAGLVIWGKGCGQEGVYGVYVDVTKYTDWIATNLNTLQFS